MVIDTSAVLAILLAEPEAKSQIEIVSMDERQYEIARRAFRRYGKGNHPAGLNIGDCCSCALSKYSDEPLLHKGDDFSRTDVERAGY